jgi:type I restriction enzyme S subunit
VNPELLLTLFDRLGDVANAIPRLRRFIFALAVRGKLVKQDPNDEPAAALLGGDRRLPQDSETEPWNLPSGWAWSSLDLIGETLGGGTPSKADPQFWNGSIPWVSPKDMKVDVLIDAHDHISTSAVEHSATRLIPTGSLVMVVRGMILAHSFPTAITAVPVTINQDMKALVPFRSDLIRFLLLLTKGLKPEVLRLVRRSTHGTCKLLTADLFSLPISIPPFAEQHRIVAKVDELMALCDRLEAAQTERESRRVWLASSCLYHLTNSENAESIHDHAHFYLTHLPRLTARHEQIKELRKIIFNLAVRGQLVPQDPEDEPASEMLERIHTQKAHETFPEMAPDTIPFRIPLGWQWIRFGQIITAADAGWSPTTEGFPRSGAEWGVLKVSAVSWDRFLPDENKQLLPDVIPPERARVRRGDFLISRANTSALVAKCVVVKEEPTNLILSDKIVRLQIAVECNQEFVCMVNNYAAHARSYYAEEASGTSLSMKNVSRAVIYALAVPLPPAAEQHRIVATVDRLMALCDRLEAQLKISQIDQHLLLEAVLHQALKSDEGANGRLTESGGLFGHTSPSLRRNPGQPAAI